MLTRVLGASPELELTATARAGGGQLVEFDASRDSVAELLAGGEYEWIVNAIGVIGPRIDERDPASVALARDVNAAFPQRLSAATGPEQRVLQIATDGVFAGADAPYDETAPHDAHDTYGETKSAGEVAAPNFLNLRCSIIGPEPDPPSSLLGWALSQPRGARITGYTNHRWNGVTTLHFARLCEAAIGGGAGELPSPLHVVPADTVTKAELLELVLNAFGRSDVSVEPAPAERSIDRTLATIHPDASRRLWAAAGYVEPPTIAEMVDELARFASGAGAG
jgi:dTDP-4-dehydrorhamnose reductase